MQHGNLVRSTRQPGPNIWKFRYWNRRHDGRWVYRRLTIGTLSSRRTKYPPERELWGVGNASATQLWRQMLNRQISVSIFGDFVDSPFTECGLGIEGRPDCCARSGSNCCEGGTNGSRLSAGASVTSLVGGVAPVLGVESASRAAGTLGLALDPRVFPAAHFRPVAVRVGVLDARA
jgi:hypothetical protein